VSQVALFLAAVLLSVFVATISLFISRVKSGNVPTLRRIQGYDLIKNSTSRAIEAGRPLHLSMGIGAITNSTTADSLAGLQTLHHLSRQAAVTGVPPIVSMADPILMLFAQNQLRIASESGSMEATKAYRHVRWIAPQPAAYAGGVMSLLSVENAGANIMIGQFGDEYLLFGEASNRHEITHVGGTSNPNTLPFIYATAHETLLGEEIYAAGAYLQKLPTHIGSLLAQDTVRWIVAGLILGGVTLKSMGWW
jgi:hypothetical protein